MPEVTGTRDLRSYLRMFWRWKWLFLFFLIAAPAAAYASDQGHAPTYSATTLVGVNQATVNSSLVNGSGSFSTSNIVAIAQLVTTTPVADIAAGLLSPRGDPGQVAGEISATGDPSTNFLRITAQDRTPARAAAVANAFARAISLDLQHASVAQIDSSIVSIRKQLATLKRRDVSTRATLEQQLTQLVASRTTQGGQAAILQAASPSAAAASGTSVRRTVELGLLIGLLLGFGAVLLAESADRRLRSPDDLEDVTDLPLLASIAPSAFSAQLDTSELDDEAFHMLRTALTYFHSERHLDSLLITSPGEKDGKTTVATRLAIVMARAGQDVILVDADLRRAQVSAKLGIGRTAGLESVLAGDTELSDALVDYPLDGLSRGHLRVLPAGPPPPDPSALISSPRMQSVLQTLVDESDVVIIDTPAALAVSDPLPLMGSVSGIVLVARMNTSTRERIRRLQRMISSAHGTLLGVVATGAAAGPVYDGYSSKHYGPTPPTDTSGRAGESKTVGPAAVSTPDIEQ